MTMPLARSTSIILNSLIIIQIVHQSVPSTWHSASMRTSECQSIPRRQPIDLEWEIENRNSPSLLKVWRINWLITHQSSLALSQSRTLTVNDRVTGRIVRAEPLRYWLSGSLAAGCSLAQRSPRRIAWRELRYLRISKLICKLTIVRKTSTRDLFADCQLSTPDCDSS